MISRKDDDDEDDYDDDRKFHLTAIGQNVAHVHTHILRQKESTYVFMYRKCQIIGHLHRKTYNAKIYKLLRIQ